MVEAAPGDRFFRTEGDVKRYALLETGNELRDVVSLARSAFKRFESFPAAINGYAIGGGFEMLLATDLRIAAPTAKISMPQVRLGIINAIAEDGDVVGAAMKFVAEVEKAGTRAAVPQCCSASSSAVAVA
ncbi:MAG: enoyl-CoA hydratase-related protein [Rhodospirillaceae bacterium]|nr:enoyl-CoA hydratase-related protein [Rhodospirillaceae bacterium]